MKKILSGSTDESPMMRLPKGDGSLENSQLTKAVAVSKKGGSTQSSQLSKHGYEQYKFLPAFWTVASVMSFAVNIVLLIILAVVIQNFSSVGLTVTGIGSHLLGGLYENFVKMDQAHIKTQIPVSQEIPVQFSLNVTGPTNVVLTQDVAITGALVTINSDVLNINRARANIVLPQGTILPISVENLVVPVDQKVLAELNVGVDIPLNQTELHEPFVGLRQVVEPFYCLLEPCP